MNGPKDYKDGLVNWGSRDTVVTPDNIARWHKGATYHHYPDKARLREEGGDAVTLGWLPRRPLIGRDTRVLAVGSCFARNFTLWLAEHGFNRAFPQSPYNALLQFNADFESPAVVAQQFRWAFDELDPQALLWIDKNRHLIAATDEGKRAVRETLEQTDVLIITLGLSEIWYDNVSGEPLWRALTQETFDPARHVFRVESVAQTLEWLETIERLRRERLPALKIVFTVSPIPLHTTFRPGVRDDGEFRLQGHHPRRAREFLRRHEREVGEKLFYFPAYEFVTDYFVDPFREDNRHLAPIVPGTIISYFVRHYCDGEMQPRREDDAPGTMPKMIDRVMRHSTLVGGEDARAPASCWCVWPSWRRTSASCSASATSARW
jgi:hypothetical protein